MNHQQPYREFSETPWWRRCWFVEICCIVGLLFPPLFVLIAVISLTGPIFKRTIAPNGLEEVWPRSVHWFMYVAAVVLVGTYLLRMTNFDLGYLFHLPEQRAAQGNDQATPVAPIQTPEETPPSVSTPPSIPAGASLRLLIHPGNDAAPIKAGALLLQTSGTRQWVVTSAHCLSKEAWESTQRVQLVSSSNVLMGEVSGCPTYLGEHTADHAPNLLEKPEMGQGLAVWELPPTIKLKGLTLATNCQKDEDVWLLGHQWKDQPQQHLYHCHIAENAKNILYVHQLDRFAFEDFVGAPFVNSRGQVVGVLLGGGDFALVGAGVPAIQKQMSLWKMDMQR